jgi:hypothetical protein
LRRRFFGNRGSISLHKSSSINGSGILSPSGDKMPHGTNAPIKVQESFC